MSQIGYIAPNMKMATIAKNVFSKHGIDVAVEIGNIENGADKAEILVKNGVKAFIARGGTVLSIRNRLDVPVIEISITTEDIANAVLKASKFGSNIEIIGFYNLVNGLESFNSLLTVKLKQVYVENKDQFYEEIYKAKKQGINAIIGGAIQCKIAKKLGLHSIFLESGSQAIYDAYCQSEVLVNSLLQERQKAEEIRAILDYARDGFVAINNKGEITLINDAAAKMFKCSVAEVIGKSLVKVCPSLDSLIEVLHTGKEHINDITNIGSMSIIYNRIPIVVQEQIVGAVVTFQDVNILEEAESKARRKINERGLYAKYTFDDIYGISEEIKKTIKVAIQFAKSESTVLITGETGTGKEVFAQSIHNASYRMKGPFVAVNCASLPQTLLESELFGYVEGAFTGARKKGKIGLFELAHKGTIFLDEISEIPLELQGRLLRVLQERSVMRLGDDKIIPIDVRIIVATNRDLVDYVKQGHFREDLFFRLNILALHLPPLRQRTEDIPVLADQFLQEYNSPNKSLILSEKALDILTSYRWPGNIRELRNLMEKISILNTGDFIELELIKEFMETNRKLFSTDVVKSIPTMQKVEEVLATVDNNKSKAAKILGVDRSTLWRWLKKNKNIT